MEDVGKGRVRIMEWLPIDTLTLLSNEYVVLSVHHGGSSIYVSIPFPILSTKRILPQSTHKASP